MIIRELFYKDRAIEDDKERYDPALDQSGMKRGFSRRTRLTLKQINQARRADELHSFEKEEELQFVKQMYGIVSQSNMGAEQGVEQFGGI